MPPLPSHKTPSTASTIPSHLLFAAVLFLSSLLLAAYTFSRPPTVVRVCHEPAAAPPPPPRWQFLATPEQLARAGMGGAHTTVSLPPWVFAAPAALPPFAAAPLPTANFFTAQDYEDQFAAYDIFFGLRGGVILESGALDGVQFSVSNHFVKALGWRAVHVEANPASFELLKANRPESLNLHAALCTREEPLHWCGSGPAGGFWEFMSDTHKTAFWPNEKVESMAAVPCVPLAPLLGMFGVRHVNLWCVRAELLRVG